MAANSLPATDSRISIALEPSAPPTSGPVRILALDGAPGGAIRGFAQIKIIRALMVEIWKREHVGEPVLDSEIDKMRPCDHFNLILGSGTGGAIAVYLGRLNLTIKQCEDFYKELGDKVYGQPLSGWDPRIRYTYDHELMECALKEQTQRVLPEGASILKFGHQRQNSPGCKVAVLTKMVYNTQAVHLVKSYEPDNGEVWQVIRATTASYWDFPNIKVGHLLLLGPEAGSNNPSGKAWVEATTLYPKSLNKGIWFVSVGSISEYRNVLKHPPPNAWEIRIHAWMTWTRSMLMAAGVLVEKKSPQLVKTVVSTVRRQVGTWAGYGWDFAWGELPGRAEELRLLTIESNSRHQEMRDRMRRSSLDAGETEFRYYRLNLKMDRKLFTPNAWTMHQGLLSSTLSAKNIDLLPEAPLMQTINMTHVYLLHPPIQPNEPYKPPPVRILTLDGAPGCMNALVQLRILRELMVAVWKKERGNRGEQAHPFPHDIDKMRPYDYFDLIVGSGTGGAIAAYLGWWRLTIEECEHYFRAIADEVYAKPFSRWNMFQEYNYDQNLLQTLLKYQVRAVDIPADPDDPQRNRRSQHKFCYQRQDDTDCKVAILASNNVNGSTGILRSYQYEGLEAAHDADVWQAMLATMASHGDFAPVQIGNVCLRGPDASFSNPLAVAHQEGQRIFGLQRSTCVVSIGSGLQPQLLIEPLLIEDWIRDTSIRIRTRIPTVARLFARGDLPDAVVSLRDLAMGCENEDRKMIQKMRPNDLSHYFDPASSSYFRFNIVDKEGLLIESRWTDAESRVEQWASEEYPSGDTIGFNTLNKLQQASQFL